MALLMGVRQFFPLETSRPSGEPEIIRHRHPPGRDAMAKIPTAIITETLSVDVQRTACLFKTDRQKMIESHGSGGVALPTSLHRTRKKVEFGKQRVPEPR